MKLNRIFSPFPSKSSKKKAGAIRKELFCEVQALQGMIGHTLTKLKMIGYIEVNGKRFEAKSLNGVIQPGVPVKIIGNAFGVLTVKPLKNIIKGTLNLRKSLTKEKD